MLSALGATSGVEVRPDDQSIEAKKLALDSSLARKILGWGDRLVGLDAIRASASWYKQWRQDADMRAITLTEIDNYQNGELDLGR